MKVKEENEKACLKLNIKNTNIMAPDLIREKWTQWQILFSWAPKSLWVVTAAMKLKDICSMESYDKPRQHIKKQRHHFANKGAYSQSYGFSSSHVQMWELDHKESLSAEKLMLSNCGTGEDFWEYLGLQGVQTS